MHTVPITFTRYLLELEFQNLINHLKTKFVFPCIENAAIGDIIAFKYSSGQSYKNKRFHTGFSCKGATWTINCTIKNIVRMSEENITGNIYIYEINKVDLNFSKVSIN